MNSFLCIIRILLNVPINKVSIFFLATILSVLTFLPWNANASPEKNSEIKQYAMQENWWEDELIKKRKILDAFWQERIIKYNKKSVNDFNKFITATHFPNDDVWNRKIDQLFYDAVDQRIGFDIFFSTLEDLPLIIFKIMNNAEKLIPDELREEITPDIKKDDLQSMEQYIKNKRISASITLGSANKEIITPEFPENLSHNTFAIHSVGKVFTGILTFLMIREGILSEENLQRSVQLDESIKKQLPPAVREQLTKVTLHQLMTHTAGIGDYLGNYTKAISEGNIPTIKQAEDFVPFIEEKTFPIGEMHYSNAGILLVGLAVKHAYEAKFKQAINYDDLLQKYIILEVGMPSFSPWKPENGKFNLNDPIAPHIVGSPAGGYWVTTEDLAKFAQWIYKKSYSDPAFKMLIEKYGQEFYSADHQLVAHGGGISSSSASFSVSLKTGAISVILSDQPHMAFDLDAMIQEHLFSRKILQIRDLGLNGGINSNSNA